MGSSTLKTTLFELSGGEVEVVAKEDLSKIIFSMSGVWASDFCSSSFGESTQICTIGYGIESRGDESNYKIYFIRKKETMLSLNFCTYLAASQLWPHRDLFDILHFHDEQSHDEWVFDLNLYLVLLEFPGKHQLLEYLRQRLKWDLWEISYKKNYDKMDLVTCHT